MLLVFSTGTACNSGLVAGSLSPEHGQVESEYPNSTVRALALSAVLTSWVFPPTAWALGLRHLKTDCTKKAPLGPRRLAECCGQHDPLLERHACALV